MSSVGEELPKEMARVRDELIPQYESVGEAGRPAVFLMKRDLDSATKALSEGDVVGIIRAYESLRGWKS